MKSWLDRWFYALKDHVIGRRCLRSEALSFLALLHAFPLHGTSRLARRGIEVTFQRLCVVLRGSKFGDSGWRRLVVIGSLKSFICLERRPA